MAWEIIVVPEVEDWYLKLDEESSDAVERAIEMLADEGPDLGRPMADRVHGSRLRQEANVKVKVKG